MGLLSRRFNATVVSGTARPEPAALRRVRYLRWGALGSRFKPVEWLRLLAGALHIRRLLLRYIPGLRGETAVIYNPPPPLPGAGKELGGEPVLVYAGGSSCAKGVHVLRELLREAAKGGARRPAGSTWWPGAARRVR